MATETRTETQVDANQIDMDMHRLVGRLHQFGEDVRSSAVLGAAANLSSSRHQVRKHMHPKDQETTNG